MSTPPNKVNPSIYTVTVFALAFSCSLSDTPPKIDVVFVFTFTLDGKRTSTEPKIAEVLITQSLGI